MVRWLPDSQHVIDFDIDQIAARGCRCRQRSAGGRRASSYRCRQALKGLRLRRMVAHCSTAASAPKQISGLLNASRDSGLGARGWGLGAREMNRARDARLEITPWTSPEGLDVLRRCSPEGLDALRWAALKGWTTDGPATDD